MSNTTQEQAVIFGATGTVGSAIVARLVARGMRVVAVARARDKLDSLAAASPEVKRALRTSPMMRRSQRFVQSSTDP